MEIKTNFQEKSVLIKILGKSLDIQEIKNFKDTLFAIAQNGHKEIHVDLADVERIDSSGIALFVSFWKTFGSKIKLKFYFLQPHIKTIFKSSNLNKIFEMYDTETDALSSVEHK